jgi:GGDEF domain-containing protein
VPAARAPEWRLPVSGALAIANLSVVLWLSVRATQLGDRLAWGLAMGCLLTLPAQIGLYGMALNTTRPPLLLQAGVALAALLSVVITAAMLWLRNHQTRQMMQGEVSRRDPITQLYDGVAMVQKIIRAQRRRLRTRRDGALMAVLLFEPERLLPQIGQAGLNDIYIQLARRMQRHTGTVNPAGRYYDRCFVVLLETMHSPRWIRTLGLRVATSLRRPMDVPSLDGRHIRIAPDIAVGIVHLSAAGQGRGPVAARGAIGG